uniref:Thioredoxin domain-containing protein n=1 Tax=Globodera pallida TaxID=36090 RepID=A0A183BRP7_GLOPA
MGADGLKNFGNRNSDPKKGCPRLKFLDLKICAHWHFVVTPPPPLFLVSFGSVDCDAFPDICEGEYVHSFPTIRLYRHRHDLQPYDYPPNWWRNAQSMTHWLAEMMPTLVQRLAGDFHSTVLGSVQPFLVDFYAPWCGHCVHFAPTFEKLAKLLEGQVQLGKVDCDRFGHICQMAGVQAFPSVMLYSGVDRVGDRQNAQGIFVRHGGDASRMADEHTKSKHWS